MTASPRRWLTLALAPLVATALFVSPATSASAAPGGSSPTAEEEGNADLSTAMESTNRRYVAAKGAVAESRKNQKKLAGDIKAAESRRDALIPEVNSIARQQYQTGNLSAVGFLLQASSSNDFMSKAISLEEINKLHDEKLHELNEAIATVTESKTKLDAELKNEQQQLTILQKQKDSADKQLDLLGGGTGINKTITRGFVDAKSKEASPAPRNASGGFSSEGCTERDETTSGCVTKRTLHMYKEVRKANFKRFVGCHRNGGPFEHPKGRACDWSLQKSGFSAAHNDDMMRYGNDLTAFLVRNADKLGIYYVIWYKQIWFPATNEWRSYSGPSDHTDHVHVSML
ncbi:coiled-coil domain-containing protein [Actinoplanes sp. GCM10030250]|uniref:coiled-coil domain-containing protein n=1 Tax=Actinoplanes sp. GCM10030250 TaxID=3273376 RepID=UPI00360745B5